MIGEWAGRYTYELTAPENLGDVPSVLDRLSVRMLPWLPLRLATTVTATRDPDVFVHTTALWCLFWPMMWSEERIVVGPSGKAAELEGEQRRWPLIWQRTPIDGGVVIGEDAASAVYRMRLLGAELVMRTKVVGEGRLQITQETSYSLARVTLERFV
ncbi:MAG: hypothetical protein H6735_12175 [Alphaproteobacteria bacterium]|nr:hypothetical protein [Alphaproteobacteria bacterium]